MFGGSKFLTSALALLLVLNQWNMTVAQQNNGNDGSRLTINKVEYASRKVDVDGQVFNLVAMVMTFDQPVQIPDELVDQAMQSMADEGGGGGNGGGGNGGNGGGSGNVVAAGEQLTDSSSGRQSINVHGHTIWYEISRLTYSNNKVPFNLTCNGISHLQPTAPSQNQESQGPPPVIFFPASKDYIADFLATMFSVTQLVTKGAALERNRIVALFFNSMTDGDSPTAVPISRIPNIIQALNAGTCSLRVKGIFSGSNGQPIDMEVSKTAIKQGKAPSCHYQKLSKLLLEFQDVLASMGGISDDTALKQARSYIDVITMTDTWIGCKNIIDSAMIRGTSTVTSQSSDCTFEKDTLQYAADPCCNKTLEYRVCCAPRTVSRAVPVLQGVNATYLAMTCSTSPTVIANLIGVLNAYVSIQQSIDDPTSGCRAGTLRSLDTNKINYYAIWTKYYTFISSCYSKIFGTGGKGGSGESCKTDVDCYTSCVKSGTSDTGSCSIPWGDPSPYLQKCFIAEMNPTIKMTLLRLWGVYDVKDLSQFSEQFRNRTATYQCSGPTSYKYNGGWYKIPTAQEYQQMPGNQQNNNGGNGGGSYTPLSIPTHTSINSKGIKIYADSVYSNIGSGYTWCNTRGGQSEMEAAGCFYLPPSQSACVADTQCNWWGGFGGSQSCSLDRLQNGGKFCGQCYGGAQCMDVSQKGGCYLSEYDWTPFYNHETQTMDTSSPRFLNLRSNCTAVGGTLFADPSQPWMTPRCFLDNVNTKVQCLDACMTGPKPAQRYVCANRAISTESDCQVTDQYGNSRAYMNWQYNHVTRTYRKLCQAHAWDSNSCAQIGNGFTWQPFSSDANELAQENLENCRMNYCFNKQLNTTMKCDHWNHANQGDNNVWANWMENLNDGKGYCTVFINSHESNWKEQKAKCESIGSGWQFYVGRNFLQGVADTQASCEEGVCNMAPGLEKSECDTVAYCDRSCTGCSQGYNSDNSEICYHRNQTICTKDSGANSQAISWTSVSPLGNVCLYTGVETAKCASISGARMQSCKNYQQDSCTTNPFQTQLGCQYGYKMCDSQAECESSGECNDYNIAESGTCVLPPQIDQWGYPSCYEYKDIETSPMQLGCEADSLTNVTCSQNGGEWVTQASNKEQCLQRKGCCEPGKNCDWQLSAKNATECAKCGGVIRPYFSWRSGSWRAAQVVPMEWKTRQIAPVNSWTPSIDQRIMEQYVNFAVGAHMAQVFMTETKCRLAPLARFMKIVACSCGTNLDSTCATVNSGSQETELSDMRVACGAQSSTYAAGIIVNVANNSVQDCKSSQNVKVGMLISKPNTDSAATGSGSLTLRRRDENLILLGKRDTTSTTVTANCYVVVQNSNNAYVGQLRGDCVVFSPSGTVSGVEVCMQVKSSIPYDATTYPTFGVAIGTTSGSTVKYTASTVLTPYASGSQYCILVNSAGTYCPASFKSDFASATTGDQPACNVATAAMEAVTAADAALLGSSTQLQLVGTLDTTIQAGNYFTPFTVEFRDSNNALVTSAAASVTLSIVSGTGTSGATVVGSARVAAVNGVATFDEVSVDLVGTGYRLVASASSLTVAQSTEFSVTPGPAAALLFTTQPGGAVDSVAILQAPVVSIADTYGNTVTSSTATISLTVWKNSVVYTSFTGTTSAAAASGVATFSTLTFTGITSGLAITASSTGLSTATSITFSVVGPNGYAAKLRFGTSPAGAEAGTAFTTQPVVNVLDYNNVIVTSATGSVALAIKSGAGTSGASITGTKSLAVVGGSSTFTGLAIDRAGTEYVLVASQSGLAAAQSTAFTVNGAYSIAFSTQPSATYTTTGSITVAVEILDLNGARMTSSADYVSLGIKPFTGTSGAAISGIARVRASSGVASFSGLKIQLAGTGYKFYAQTDAGLAVDSTAFTVSGTGTTVLGVTLTPIIIAVAIAGAILLFVIIAMILRSRAERKRKEAAKTMKGTSY